MQKAVDAFLAGATSGTGESDDEEEETEEDMEQ